MGTYNLKEEIKVFCATAKSFPDGIMEAFQTLEKLAPEICDRTFFGISRPDEQNKIIYKAAVQEVFDGEGKSYGLEEFTIPRGKYLIEILRDWKDQTELFAITFNKLLKDPQLDTDFPCIEWYKSQNEVMCMVKLKN